MSTRKRTTPEGSIGNIPSHQEINCQTQVQKGLGRPKRPERCEREMMVQEHSSRKGSHKSFFRSTTERRAIPGGRGANVIQTVNNEPLSRSGVAWVVEATRKDQCKEIGKGVPVWRTHPSVAGNHQPHPSPADC